MNGSDCLVSDQYMHPRLSEVAISDDLGEVRSWFRAYCAGCS